MARLNDYSKLPESVLCVRCEHGQIIESDQGHTLILCHEVRPTLQLPFPPTKCSRFEKKQLPHLWNAAAIVMIEDGHLMQQQYDSAKHDNVWVRAVPDKETPS